MPQNIAHPSRPTQLRYHQSPRYVTAPYQSPFFPSGSQRLCKVVVCPPRLLPANSPHGALSGISRCSELSFSSFYRLFTRFSITVNFFLLKLLWLRYQRGHFFFPVRDYSRVLRPYIFSLPLLPFISSLLSTRTANRSSTIEWQQLKRPKRFQCVWWHL